MDVYYHLFFFCDVFILTLQSHSFIVILRGLLLNFFYYLLTCCIVYGAIFYFRIPRPPDCKVKGILGNEWGAYKTAESLEEATSNNVIKVIGHRACGLDAPENSLSALKMMHLRGIKMVEFDVALTSDNVPIVFHDSNVYRLTDVNKNVAEMSLKEIQKLDISVKHPFGKEFSKERVPKLYDFVTSCIVKNIKMVIDLKDGGKEMIKVINGLFKDFPELYDLAIVSSFNPFDIYRIRRNDPKIVSSLCWRPYYYSHEEYNGLEGPSVRRSSNPLIMVFQSFLNILHHWFLWNIAYYIVGASVILLSKDAVTREYIQYWRKRGIRLIAWNVNLPSEKQYFENSLQITYLTDTIINS